MLSRAARAGAALALGGGLAAVQLVPTALFVATTTRAGGIERADALRWSTHPLRLLGLVAPSLFRLDRLQPWSELFEQNTYQEPLLSSLYMSIPLLVLAGIAIAHDRRSRTIAWAAVVVVLAALGRYGAPAGLPSLRDRCELGRGRRPPRGMGATATRLIARQNPAPSALPVGTDAPDGTRPYRRPDPSSEGSVRSPVAPPGHSATIASPSIRSGTRTSERPHGGPAMHSPVSGR
jgi:hypothetical protein